MTHFVIRLKKDDDASLYLLRAAEIVQEGGIIGYPTNTVYGMGCDPLNILAVKSIFSLKMRALDQGLPVLVADLEEAQKVAVFSESERKIAEKFWPGKVTIILKLKTQETEEKSGKNTYLDKIVTGGRDTIALRVPENPIILGICKELKKIHSFGGIIGTSANISGESNPISGKRVIEEFGMALNFIISTGKVKDKIPSTIIKIDNDLIEKSIEDAVTVFREGLVKKEEILNTLSIK